MPNPIHHPIEFEVEEQRHGMGQLQGKGPLGEAVGGVSVPSGNMSLCSVPTTLLAGVSMRAEREGGVSPKSPRPGRGGNMSDSCFGPSPAPGALQLLSARFSHLCGMLCPK